MNPLHLDQGSPEWLAYRLGKCTGSRVADALSFLRNGEPSARRNGYMAELLAERMTGRAAEHFVSYEMEHGAATEPLACAAYEVATGTDVDRIGICQHPLIGDFCASPDRIVGEVGLIEVKCPKTVTHMRWVLDGVVPEEHLPQMYAELACSGRDWADFVSFDPRVPLRYQIFVVRLNPDREMLGSVEEGVRRFLLDTERMQSRLDERCPPIAMPGPEPHWSDQALLSDADIDDFFDAMPVMQEQR